MSAATLPAQTLKTLHSFGGTDGGYPSTGLVQGTNGNLYGTTTFGGANGYGMVFKITPSGTLTTLYSFDLTDGAYPNALVQASNGNLYGTTYNGGANTNSCGGGGCGTVFKITTSGTLTTLHSFAGLDGGFPSAGLVQVTDDGNLYGTTLEGGASGGACQNPLGCGTVFVITPSGALTTLHSFDNTDGSNPQGALIQGTDGKFYGTTSQGGGYSYCNGHGYSCGTVFKITPGGKLTTLHSFRGTDGDAPEATLAQAADGNLYGTTSKGGANNLCNGACGTVFKITSRGMLTTLYNFCSRSACADGYTPYAGLVEGTDGNFYGTTYAGGANAACYMGATCGTAFKITTSGTLTTLHSFCAQTNCADGTHPQAGLVQDTNGRLYGTTVNGGANGACTDPSGCGTVFSLSVGLGPFVETQPTSGTAGAPVKILGTNLTGATSVTFNGTAAAFTVKSKSEITTTVPTGATTGTIQVVTPGGTLSSNVPFRVTP
jgi:uncharacterized repeat protein (TIGR03803 family)